MRSIMTHMFNQIPAAEIPRSAFDLSHGHKTTLNAGTVVPFLIEETLPGDTFHVKTAMFIRMMTQIVPIMDNIFVDTFYFAVPYRLVWANFVKMMGERKNPNDSIDFSVSQATSASTGGFAENTLADHFGIATKKQGLSVSALPFRAYYLIWNEWFRDQNLQERLPDYTDDVTRDYSSYGFLKRTKRHDYFTSALLWPQKGNAVQVPLGLTAPVIGNGLALGLTDDILNHSYPLMLDRTVGSDSNTKIAPGSHSQYGSEVGTTTTNLASGELHKTAGVVMDPDNSGLVADLTDASTITINMLREAIQLQRLQERDARGGTRYTEMILAHFGVRSPDMRLQRPEYLGGSTFRMNINPVQQTSSTDSTSPQGNLAAFGVASDRNGGFTKSFTEHGIIMGLLSIRADVTYQQGIPRMFSRKTRYDFYWPALAHLGEQEILQKEIFASGVTGEDLQVFGYQERYAEYRYHPSQITGKLRSNATGSLDVWHLSQNFASAPSLDYSFIEEAPRMDCIAVENEPQFLMDSFIEIRAARPMPVHSVPGMMDHF